MSVNKINQATLWVAFVFVMSLTVLALDDSAARSEDSADGESNTENNSDSNTDEQSARIYLALADEHERPLSLEKKSFGCEEKIFAVAELSNYPLGKHEFSVQWTDPANTLREHTRYPFHINTKETRLWSWLSLRRGAGAGMLQWLDPAAGLEDFIGPWKIEVHIDGKKLATLEMEVNC